MSENRRSEKHCSVYAELIDSLFLLLFEVFFLGVGSLLAKRGAVFDKSLNDFLTTNSLVFHGIDFFFRDLLCGIIIPGRKNKGYTGLEKEYIENYTIR